MINDEELLKLAASINKGWGSVWSATKLLAFARAIESATLEKAAVKCEKEWTLEDAAAAIRASIGETL